MDTELAKKIEFAQELLDAAIEVVGAAKVEITAEGARNSKVLSLAVLCRSISNFRAAILLVQQEQVLEGRALARLIYENLLWLGALRERGADFVAAMIEDEAFNRRALAQLTLEITGRQGGDIEGPDAIKLRSIVKELVIKFPNSRKLNAYKTAGAGVVETAYVEYSVLSLEAVHCSVTALGKHLTKETVGDTTELVINVVPAAPPKEAQSTVLHACRALLGVAIGADELIGHTSVSDRLAKLMDRFEANGWQTED